MLQYKDIEYGELLQRCAYGEIDTNGYRFDVGNYVVVFHNDDTDVVCLAGVYITVSELRKRLLELSEEYELCGESVGWNVCRVVPTGDDDEDACDECKQDAPLRSTVLVPYTEVAFRVFYAAMQSGVVADPYGFGGCLLRGDLVAVKQQAEGASYRIVNVYDFIDGDSALAILKEYVVDGARLVLLS